MPHTLLLADDSVTIQRVIELTFADEDIQVVAVSDGDQAVAVLDTTPPDIVLVDVGMPGRSGYEVARHIKDTPRLAHIPVVLLTGAFEPIDQAKAEAAGCDGVLAKPFEPQLVIGRVKELLARPRVVSPALEGRLAPPPAPPAGASAPFPDTRAADASAARAAGDDYFDRLDQAIGRTAVAEPALPPPPPAPPPIADAVDWFSVEPAAQSSAVGSDRWEVASPRPTPDPLPSYGAASADFDKLGSLAVSALERSPAAPRSVPPASPTQLAAPPAPPPTPLPPLADAFAALLAAEQSGPAPAGAPAWPAAPSGAVVTEELIEEVTRRVLDRLSDRVVRETVAETVSKVAEQLVRAEIDRIKARIK